MCHIKKGIPPGHTAKQLITTSHPCYEHRDNPELIMAYTVAHLLELYANNIFMHIRYIQDID
jgi:hypothetical protein